jgi:hypothetical protein
MRHASSTLNATTKLAAVGLGLIVLNASFAASGDDVQPYTWSAQLVAFDKAANTVTLKARVVTNTDAQQTAQLHPGDAAMLTWSGLSFGSGVRAVVPGTKSPFDRLTMPIEYVSSEMDGRYVSFKVPIPAQDVAAMEKLASGAWVTVTTPQRPANIAQVVTHIRRYDDVS